jgi:hypothetical protein
VIYSEISYPEEEEDDDYWTCKWSSDTSHNTQNTHISHMVLDPTQSSTSSPLGCETEPDIISHASFTPVLGSLEIFTSQETMGF